MSNLVIGPCLCFWNPTWNLNLIGLNQEMQYFHCCCLSLPLTEGPVSPKATLIWRLPLLRQIVGIRWRFLFFIRALPTIIVNFKGYHYTPVLYGIKKAQLKRWPGSSWWKIFVHQWLIGELPIHFSNLLEVKTGWGHGEDSVFWIHRLITSVSAADPSASLYLD